MDDFEDRENEAIEAGKRNLEATRLLKNWCFHAEFARSGGRGMIEAATGLPIGHMGVQCKFSKNNSMFCWLLEDAIYDFYQNNCKGCKDRVPIGFPNIVSFVSAREESAEKRKRERDAEETKLYQKRINRHQERANLRPELTLEETFVFDLLDDLDSEDIAKDDPRLEQLANLAPETFTRKVIEHLLLALLGEHLPYSDHAAKALHRAPLELVEKLLVAVYLVNHHDTSPTVIDTILTNADKLSKEDLTSILHHFTYIAVGPPPEMHFLGVGQFMPDSAPIQALFPKRRSDICAIVNSLIIDADRQKMVAALKIIIATNSDELLLLHVGSICSMLVNRKRLFPRERKGSSVLYYLREAASKCFNRFPDETNRFIESLPVDNNDTGKEEIQLIYRSAMRHHYREQVQIGTAQRIAFKKLLWSAMERPEDTMDDGAQFFRHSSNEYAQLAVEHFDELIGAAAVLSERYEQIDRELKLERIETMLDRMTNSNKRTSIDSLQNALIEWAAIGAKSKGREGVDQFMELYRKLPKTQPQIRGNMIVHASKLLTGIESLNLILSDWYSALMDENQIVRAQAARAWEDVPYDLMENFPDLFFESFSVLLTDPYVIVHKTAVRSLRQRPFPEDKRILIKSQLWNLIIYYSQESKQNDFVVDCIDTFALLFLSSDERNKKIDLVLSGILLNLEGSALYHAVDRLSYNFISSPSFIKVAIKSIQDDYTRSISIDDCVSVILRTPRNELLHCVDDIQKALKGLLPFKPDNFYEALVYAYALTRTEKSVVLSECFKELISSIPLEDRNEQWRLEASLVATASDIEHAIASGGAPAELIEKWSTFLSGLEKENEERAKLRDIPPQFFFEA